ncbi:DNA mismatch repair endonuclease MutL [bacterium]|nr:DNA mismatch repair endonuclease MutL [bacterium]
MNVIKVLSENVTNRIAAGEVIERPVSVVKELVENSLDAGATSIYIKIDQGGKELIQVTDDGKGMSNDDALLCLERHATSKIRDVEDIVHISSLGFRGEAIPSIASISRFNLITKDEESDVAVDIYVDGGKLKDVRRTAANTGTTISVKKIFFNVPARRKFLKSDIVEFKHILNYVHYQSILYPNVSFKLVANDREKLNYPAVNNYNRRIKEVFGKSFQEQEFIELTYNTKELSIKGYIAGLEEYHKGFERYKYLFINGRYINDKIVIKALKTAYQPFIAKERYMQQGILPPYILFIEIDPELIDINVHPAKREVRFRDTHLVYNAVKDSITNRLNQLQEDKFKSIKNKFGEGFARSSREYEERSKQDNFNNNQDFTSQTNDFSLPENHQAESHSIINDGPRSFPQNANQSSYSKPDVPRFPTYKKEFSELVQPSIFDQDNDSNNFDSTLNQEQINKNEARIDLPVISEIEAVKPWQFQDTFIFIQVGEGLMVIDQHAAHERILYEKLISRMKGAEADVQKLLFPIVIDLPNYISESLKELIEENIEDFHNIGFSIKTFSGNSIVIDEIPVELEEWSGGEIFLEILQTLETEFEESEDFRDSIAKSVSCKAAIKAGKSLTGREMIKLISDLFGCKVPYYCPHGRPLIINYTLEDFKKKFKRII